MIYKSIASPKPSEGYKVQGAKLVQPDQSMSLKEIITRFTRGEAMPVSMEHQWNEQDDSELDVDLEKLKHADLVDKAEYSEKLKSVKKKWDIQEKQKSAAAKKAADDKLRAEIAEQLKKEGGSQPPPAK